MNQIKKSYDEIDTIFRSVGWDNQSNEKFRMLLLGDEDYAWRQYSADFE